MLILLTHPEKQKDEAIQLNAMLKSFSDVFLHVRKPAWSKEMHEELIVELHPDFHRRIVLHHQSDLVDTYPLKGLHLTETARKNNVSHRKTVSTSFHFMSEAKKEGERFEYFFCAPVFQSLSKKEHFPYEKWNISQEPIPLRKKAVALGGIEENTLAQTRLLGFEHIALLGAVWQANDPFRALQGIYEEWQKNG